MSFQLHYKIITFIFLHTFSWRFDFTLCFLLRVCLRVFVAMTAVQTVLLKNFTMHPLETCLLFFIALRLKETLIIKMWKHSAEMSVCMFWHQFTCDHLVWGAIKMCSCMLHSSNLSKCKQRCSVQSGFSRNKCYFHFPLGTWKLNHWSRKLRILATRTSNLTHTFKEVTQLF